MKKMKTLLVFLGFTVFRINCAVAQDLIFEDLIWDIFSGVRRKLGESNYTSEELIKSNGYEVETHQVTTTDGYILTLHRIPRGNTSKNNSKVAFLQHGILSSSADWAISGAGKALAFLLADEGYDVWMGNVRGNTYCKKHIVLDPNEAKFWNFTWHEMGTIDIPQMIDYVLNETRADGVYYVGHSQGTTVYYVMASMLPEYNSKIKVQVSMAPIGYMNHVTSPVLRILSIWIEAVEQFFKLIGLNEFMPTSDFTKYVIGDVFCQEGSITQELCIASRSLRFGFNRKQVNTTLLPFIYKFTPAGSSSKQVLHYGQEIKSGYFRQYDYGVIGNLEKYGQQSPPSYNLENITAPTYLIYSKNDWFSAEVDVERLCTEMKNGCKGKILVSDHQWNHVDYMYGIDAPELIYSNVLSLLAGY